VAEKEEESVYDYVLKFLKDYIKAQREPIEYTRDAIQKMLIKVGLQFNSKFRNKEMLKGGDPDDPNNFVGIFESEHLTNNFKVTLPTKDQRLEHQYQTKITLDELDERHFINSDNRLNTPFKLSPFARRVDQSRLSSTPKKQGSEEDVHEPPTKRPLHS